MPSLNIAPVIVVLAGVAALGVSACSPKSRPDATAQSASSAASDSSESSALVSKVAENPAGAVQGAINPEDFTGKWTGPEGTFLTITPDTDATGGKQYKVRIKNLDGPKDFTGAESVGGISFTRDGTSYVIRKGTGADTGMKDLTGKKNCLIVMAGEGYCRG